MPCNDRRSVALGAEQSRTNMLQRSVLKTIYLMARNLGRAHTPPRGARALCHKNEPQNISRGARQHTLLELNHIQSSGGIGAREITA